MVVEDSSCASFVSVSSGREEDQEEAIPAEEDEESIRDLRGDLWALAVGPFLRTTEIVRLSLVSSEFSEIARSIESNEFVLPVIREDIHILHESPSASSTPSVAAAEDKWVLIKETTLPSSPEPNSSGAPTPSCPSDAPSSSSSSSSPSTPASPPGGEGDVLRALSSEEAMLEEVARGLSRVSGEDSQMTEEHSERPAQSRDTEKEEEVEEENEKEQQLSDGSPSVVVQEEEEKEKKPPARGRSSPFIGREFEALQRILSRWPKLRLPVFGDWWLCGVSSYSNNVELYVIHSKLNFTVRLAGNTNGWFDVRRGNKFFFTCWSSSFGRPCAPFSLPAHDDERAHALTPFSPGTERSKQKEKTDGSSPFSPALQSCTRQGSFVRKPSWRVTIHPYVEGLGETVIAVETAPPSRETVVLTPGSPLIRYRNSSGRLSVIWDGEAEQGFFADRAQAAGAGVDPVFELPFVSGT